MRGGIYAIGGNIHLEDVVRGDAEVLGGRLSDDDLVGIQQDDPTIVVPYAYLHLATEHPVALYATYLTLLDGEGLPAGVEYGTYGRYDDSLARLYVGGATDDL